MRGCAASACTSRSAPCVSTSAREIPLHALVETHGALQIGHAAHLRDHQVRELRAGLADERLRDRVEGLVVDRRQPRTDPSEAVVRADQQLGDQLRMLGFAADRRAVLGVERDVEHRPELGLQLQALAHARLDAGIVIADRQCRARLAGAEQREPRVQGAGHLGITGGA